MSSPPADDDVDKAMGAIATEVLKRRGRERGNHPLCSFAAIGPAAGRLTERQTPTDVFAPLEVLARDGGFVVLAGVGLDRMTLLHHAEQVAGRTLFRRWARVRSGEVTMVAVGGCSAGFGRFDDALRSIETRVAVGESTCRVFPAQAAVEIAAAAIERDPTMTSCPRRADEREFPPAPGSGRYRPPQVISAGRHGRPHDAYRHFPRTPAAAVP